MSATTPSNGIMLGEECRVYESTPRGHILVHKALFELISRVGKIRHLCLNGRLHFSDWRLTVSVDAGAYK